MLATKYRMPSRVMPSHPEEKRRRLDANVLVEHLGPLQPGELERRYYSRGGGAGGCGGGGGTTDGGGEDIIAERRRRWIPARPSSRRVRRRGGRGRGRRGGCVVGRAIEGMCRLRPSSWPSPSSTSAVVDVCHCRGHRLVGHRRGCLCRRHRPLSTSAIVAAVDEWDMWWELMAKRGGTNLIHRCD